MKNHFKAAFEWADIAGYCFSGAKKKKRKEKTAAESTPLVCPGTVLIPGIMPEENIIDNAADMQQQEYSTSNNEESKSGDRSNYDVYHSACLLGDTLDRDGNKSNGEEEINVMDPGWKWDR
eukprot:3290958-Ditylum_brightwellii.AAC.1